MCGLAGIVLKPNQTLPDLRVRVVAMREAMQHRGPDDAGLFVSPHERVALANRRLAIRDLSPAGHMPMTDESGAVALTYNGELYNAAELRAELERAGHAFRSTSDTEVILRGYLEWGAGVVARLRGMFALAVYDGGRTTNDGRRTTDGRVTQEFVLRPSSFVVRRLLLARDPLGIKPLYYAVTPQGFVFASELKGLLASGLVTREIDPTAVVAYLMFGSVPNPRTIYGDVHSLEPGCMLSLELDSFETRCARYWHFPMGVVPNPAQPDAVERTRALLEDAVRSHLVSDVPLGAFLSGGLDSSAVVALMRRVTNGAIRTCAMVFEESEYSEAKYARAVAQHVGAEHYERVITAEDVRGELDTILAAMDQPTIDGVNTYFVSQTAREAGLTVALSGLGGDELFGGYRNTFDGVPRLLRQTRRVQRVPGAGALAQAVVSRAASHSRYARVADALDRPISPASAYLTARGLFSPSEVRALVRPDVWHTAVSNFDPVAYIAARSGAVNFDLRSLSHEFSNFDFVSRAELATYTHNQLLRDTDVMSMAHSLEVRVPLLDSRLVEQVLAMPPGVKTNGGSPKPLLLHAVGDLLPPLVRERRDKQGFVLPFERWLRGAALHAGGVTPGAGRFLQPRAVAQVRHAYERGHAHWSRVWALTVLQTWLARIECGNPNH